MTINDDILYKIDSEIGKDKKVVELQREIERLNQEIRGLNNCIIEFHSEFCNKQAEINRLNNIINIGLDKLNTQLAFTSSYQLNYQSAMSIIEETKSILQGVDKN